MPRLIQFSVSVLVTLAACQGKLGSMGSGGSDAGGTDVSGVVQDGGAPGHVRDAGEPQPPVDAGTPVTPDASVATAVDVTITVDTTTDRRPISRYVYGKNFSTAWSAQPRLTIGRLGGNRWTAYNWETNASNAGSDYYFQNDGYLGGGSTPGEAVRGPVAAAQAAGGAMLVTVPIAGWVAADKAGTSVQGQPVASRFLPISMTKPTAFSATPSLTDGVVYQDEFVDFLERAFPTAHQDPARELFYSLDNEPDLWSDTHAEIHPSPVTYAELFSKSLEAARAVKRVAPAAKVFGFVSYGYNGYVDLQGAPDANGRDFIDFFLDGFEAARVSGGVRLLDVLDLHWYPEARGGGARVTGTSTAADTVAARVQAPRSLWDPSYVEDSWITQATGRQPIRLLPWLQAKVAAHAPGTKLAFSEYSWGAGGHISGAVAQADVLGAFGREGVFAAMHWALSSDLRFVDAAFRMYRDYDGAGGVFGDTSVPALSSDVATATAWASVDAAAPSGRVVVVLINKATSPKRAALRVTHGASLTRGELYQLTEATAAPVRAADVTAQGNVAELTLPAMSVSTVVLR